MGELARGGSLAVDVGFGDRSVPWGYVTYDKLQNKHTLLLTFLVLFLSVLISAQVERFSVPRVQVFSSHVGFLVVFGIINLRACYQFDLQVCL